MIREWLEVVPPWFLGAWLFAVGLVLGSFLNVVVHRLPRGQSVVTPRSRCPSCERRIPWHENIPVVSWVLLRGRCAGCGVRISPRYVAVELLTALLVLAAFWRFGLTAALPVGILVIVLVLALVFIDWEHLLLPDAITLPATFVGLCLSWVSPFAEPAQALLGVLLGAFVIEALNLAYKLWRGHDGMGAGDTKMMMMLGAFLGWRLGLFSLVAGSVVGVIIGVPAVALVRRWTAAGRDDGERADGAGAPAPSEVAATRASPLHDLVPRTPEDAILPLVFVAAALSFVSPHVTPEAALAGLLAGTVAAIVHVLWRGRKRNGSGGRAAELWMLAGCLAGIPPTLTGSAVAAVVIVACLVLARPLRGRLPGEPPVAEEERAPGDAPSPGPGLMQAALPFGVFLGVGALISLLAGEKAIDWYLGLLAGGALP